MSVSTRRLFLIFLALLAPLLLVVALTALPATAAPASSAICLGFEGLSDGASYNVGQQFVDAGVVVYVEPFTWSNGNVFNGGKATVDNGNLAGGSGLDVNTNNVNLAFDFGQPLEGLAFRVGEYGGNLNIEINGDFRNFGDFAEIDGLTIGGASVSFASVPATGGYQGQVQLDGPIQQFAVGGQELWVDDFCPFTACVEFESLSSGTNYVYGDTFVDSGVPVSVEAFVWGSSTVYTGGHALVDNQQRAGGWGLDINANNVNLAFHFDPLPHGLSLNFGEYGGNVNIEVNGDFRNVADFPDIDGAILGGVHVRVQASPIAGGMLGRIYLSGRVEAFSIGGQELWIDNVCPASGCIEYERLPASASYAVSDLILDRVPMEVLPFTWSNGTVYTGGQALVDTSQLAGGSGQDLNLNNANLAFAFPGQLSALSLLFGEYGGNVNLAVNGVFNNVQNLAVLDGASFNGAQLSVLNGFGNDRGRLFLRGPVYSFAIGGQELWIDHVCFVEGFANYLPMIKRQE